MPVKEIDELTVLNGKHGKAWAVIDFATQTIEGKVGKLVLSPHCRMAV